MNCPDYLPRTCRAILLTAALTSAFAGRRLTAAGDRSELVAIGSTVAQFTFTDIRYLPRTLRDFGDRRAFVLVFTTLDCPVVRRYLPVLRQLDETFRDQGVQFVGINVGADDSIVDIAEQQTDRTSIGLVFAKETVRQQIRHFQCHTTRFQIPPGAPHHPVTASRTFGDDATGVGMFCHMHLRGKDMSFMATAPDGTARTLQPTNSTVPDSLVAPALAGQWSECLWRGGLNFRLKAGLRTIWDSRTKEVSRFQTNA